MNRKAKKSPKKVLGKCEERSGKGRGEQQGMDENDRRSRKWRQTVERMKRNSLVVTTTQGVKGRRKRTHTGYKMAALTIRTRKAATLGGYLHAWF